MPIKVECGNFEVPPVHSESDYQAFNLPAPSIFIDVPDGPGGIIQWYETINKVIAVVGLPQKKYEAILTASGKTARLTAQVDSGQELFPGGPHTFLTYLINVTRI